MIFINSLVRLASRRDQLDTGTRSLFVVEFGKDLTVLLLPIFGIFLLAFTLGACTLSHPQIAVLAPPMQIVADDLSIQPATEPYSLAARKYRIAVGDVLNIRYYRQPDLNTKATVASDGRVSLPFLQTVIAAGATIDEFQMQIKHMYTDLIAAAPPPQKKQYLIGIGDVLAVRFPYMPVFDSNTMVLPDGRISLPLIAPMIAEGKTLEALQNELLGLYSTQFADPIVSVSMVSLASNTVITEQGRTNIPLPGLDEIYVTLDSTLPPKVFVAGEVASPSAIDYRPTLSALQAIISVGGVTQRGELDNVIILRKNLNGQSGGYIVRNLDADIHGPMIMVARSNSSDTGEDTGNPVTNDILLQPFDVVIVPKTTITSVKDFLDRYIYDLLPPLRNSSVGFTYLKNVGTQKIEQDTKTTIVPP